MKPGTIVIGICGVLAVLYYIDQNYSTDSTDGGGVASLDQLADAITQSEGVAAFHNNPLALTAAAAAQVGADYTPNTTGGVVVNFATLADGQAAGLAFLQEFVSAHSDLTLAQGLSTYINGPNALSTISGIYPSSVLNYISSVASALGVSATATLGSIFNQ